MARTRRLAVISTALIVVLAGCGGDDDDGGNGTRSPGDDAAAAEQTMRDYIDGIVEGDGAKVCDQFTAGVREQVEQEGVDCEEAFGSLLGALTDEQRRELEAVDPQVEVTGDQAVATVPNLEGGGNETVDLRKEDGDWKIAEYGDSSNSR